ncbi:MAG TPA: HdeD family acid-resistance protein [Burkholderiaceae bacterium]|nr:HdeD family acid-resistance protein [Burkholderiaceae bacterium]
MRTKMLRYLRRNWGWIALRGLAAVLFGVMAFGWRGITLAALVIVWGAYAMADGILALIAAWQVRDQGRPFWSLIVVGMLGLAAGVVTFVWPDITALALLMVIVAWALFVGIFQIVAAIRLRKEIEGEWTLGLSGLVSVLFGVLMIVSPGAGALAMLWMTKNDQQHTEDDGVGGDRYAVASSRRVYDRSR